MSLAVLSHSKNKIPNRNMLSDIRTIFKYILYKKYISFWILLILKSTLAITSNGAEPIISEKIE